MGPGLSSAPSGEIEKALRLIYSRARGYAKTPSGIKKTFSDTPTPYQLSPAPILDTGETNSAVAMSICRMRSYGFGAAVCFLWGCVAEISRFLLHRCCWN